MPRTSNLAVSTPLLSRSALDSFQLSTETSLESLILVAEIKRLRQALTTIKESVDRSVELRASMYESTKAEYGEGSPEELAAHHELHAVANALQKVYLLADIALKLKD